MNRSLIERAMQRMADEKQQAAQAALKPANERPAAVRRDDVPTLTTLSRDNERRREAAEAARARTLIDQAARSRQRTEPTAPAVVAKPIVAAAPVAAPVPPITLTAQIEPSITESGPLTAADTGSPSIAPLTQPQEQPQSQSEPQAPATRTRTPRRTTAERQTALKPGRGDATDGDASRRQRVSIPMAALIQRGFLDPENKSATVHQEFRLIKRRLLDNAFGKLRPATENGRRIMVTSALPAEGKTFCAINLAISVAIGGEHPVLLVDADIARPTIARQLDLEDHAGLADLLADSTLDPRRCVLDTDVPGLSLLLAGAHRDQPVDLLASESMTSLLERLSQQFPDHVFIIDTPPLLAVTECRTLAANAGQVLLVVAAGETPRAALQEALQQLEVCDIVGTVLNKSPARPKSPTYYGY